MLMYDGCVCVLVLSLLVRLKKSVLTVDFQNVMWLVWKHVCSYVFAEPSAPPSGLQAQLLNGSRVLIFWNELPCALRNGQIIGYEILVTLLKNPVKRIRTSDEHKTIYILHSFTPGRTYHIQVAAINIEDTSDFSPAVSIDIPASKYHIVDINLCMIHSCDATVESLACIESAYTFLQSPCHLLIMHACTELLILHWHRATARLFSCFTLMHMVYSNKWPGIRIQMHRVHFGIWKVCANVSFCC